MPKKLISKSRGFTLLEILLVVGIIAILAGIVIVAINPTKQLAQVRNTERRSDIKQIDAAMQQYYIDKGRYPTTTPTDALTEICDTGSESPSAINCGALVDLSALVPTYITAIPKDPNAVTANGTGYEIYKPAKKLVTVAAQAELGSYIAIGEVAGGGGGGGGCDATCVALREGLIGYWPLDSDANDNSGNGNDASVNGASSGATGKVGNAYSFSGSDYIQLPIDLNGQSNITLAGWFKTDRTDAGEMVILANDNNSYGRGFQAQYNGVDYNFQAWFESGGYFYSSNFNYSTGSWIHFALVYESGQNPKLYINGSKIGEAGSIETGTGNDETFIRLGRALSGRYFYGDMDEIAIWDRALSPTEIGQLRNGGAGRSLVQ